MKGIIDRFEGEYAVVEIYDFKDYDKKRFIDIPRSKLPKEASAGDCLIIESTIKIDIQETLKRKQKIGDLFEALFED